jgi:hypothetical protein
MSKTAKTKASAGTGPTGGEYDVAALDGARRIEYMRLDAVPAADRNPKSHDLAAIVMSIARFGFTDPALLDERTGKLVGGHGRLEAVRAIKAYIDGGQGGARSAGYSLPATMWAEFRATTAEGGAVPGGVAEHDGVWSVPIVRGWASADDAEASALLIALNRMTELGGWDKGMLADLLVDLEEVDLLDITGYDSGDLDTLLAKTGKLVEVDPDPMPELDPAPAPAQPAPSSPPVNPVRNPVGDGAAGDDPEAEPGTAAAPVPSAVASPFTPPEPAELRPEPVEHYRQQYGVMVVCATEEEQNRVLAQLEHEGYRVRAITT